jgi:hypothetical protein
MSKNGRVVLSTFAFYTVLACFATYPLVRHISTAVPHDLGDPLLSTTLLWWNAHSRPLTDAWWDGIAFWPATGTLAFSDHRLGESLLATPLQWAGLSAIAAYNLTLLATFPLSAIAAHWAAFTMIRRHDAALLAGLAYGFNPYRIAHLEHLELLAGFGLAAGVASLHLFMRTRRRRWLVALAASIVLQGLCSSYYAASFAVVAVLWLAWFTRADDWRMPAGIAGAIAGAGVILLPVVIGYWRVHRFYGFARSFGEILTFSGDVTSLATASPLVTLWGWTARLNGPERQLFPGLTIATVAAVGIVAACRSCDVKRTAGWASRALAGVAAAFVAAAAITALTGGWTLDLAGLTLSSHGIAKPLSLALVAGCGALAISVYGREAYRRRSVLAFYVLASAVLFLCSFGPKPTFLGREILYEAPYAWLLQLPIFGESLRVPARFAMPAALMLSLGGAVAFARFARGGPRPALTALVALGIVADGWAAPIPMAAAPEDWSASAGEYAGGRAATLELPLGDYDRDAAAMYRAALHETPTVNGYSGFEPPYYHALRLALDEKDETVLDALTTRGPLLVASDKTDDSRGERDRWLRGHASAACIAETERWAIFDLPPSRSEPLRCADALHLAAARDSKGAVDAALLNDGDHRTLWTTGGPQQPGDFLLLDLGRAARLCSLKLSLGTHADLFPRSLIVETSATGASWTKVFAGKTGGRAVLAAIDRPQAAWMEFPLPATPPARFIRLTLAASHPTAPWIVADATVTAPP